MATTFEKETRVAPAGSQGSYEAVLDPSWRVWSGPNGGYVAATIVRAIRQSLAGAGPLRSLDVSFADPAQPGSARIETTRLREGGSVDLAQARLVQDDQLRVTARATFGAESPGPELVADPAPKVPGFDECQALPEEGPVEPPRFTQHVDYRIAGGVAPMKGEVGDRMQVWMRMAEPTSYDEALVVFLADAWMAALYAVIDEPVPVPSLDLSLQLHQLPDLDRETPLLGVFRAETAREGYAFEDGQLWTPDGDLVARARQTRRVLT